MKKAKRIIAALMSAAMTTGMTSFMTANANVNIQSGDEIAKLLEGYTRIEDPIAIEWQEYRIEKGSEYYVNNTYGSVRIIRPYPNSVVIETALDIDDEEIFKIAKEICPDAQAIRANDSLETPDIKTFEILDYNITLKQAKEIYSKLGDKVRNFGYMSGMYNVGGPQYNLSMHQYFRELYGDKANRSDFTLYSGLENEEKLRKYIEENDIPCHINAIEEIKAVDVVPDDDISYVDEIAIAAKICRNLGLKPIGIMAASSESTKGINIDLYNSVQGDANCDTEMNMSDAVLIMQSLANPSKYSITAQGQYNADSDDDGITNADALTIQKKLLKLD